MDYAKNVRIVLNVLRVLLHIINCIDGRWNDEIYTNYL